MRKVKSPGKRADWLYRRAQKADDPRAKRVWLNMLVDTIFEFKISPEDFGVKKSDLDALLDEMGLPPLIDYQELWELFNGLDF